jgi:hypothetical protein
MLSFRWCWCILYYEYAVLFIYFSRPSATGCTNQELRCVTTSTRTRAVREPALAGLVVSVMRRRPVAVVVSGAAADVCCVRFPCGWRCRSGSNVALDLRWAVVPDRKLLTVSGCSVHSANWSLACDHVVVTNMRGEVSLCDAPPTLSWF